ncbi:GIY-YIG nuclease [Marinicauda salina]|uniref:GIY-YIG nuclease n=1 Tax=Marinicauda salina TaxID=2135793 RepID=A0A2U2BXN2_9PROT|nr:GIY-YIG nuclease family protein [Marinicauda salina]PWE18757.1 GIY-YIG nuclease [Marinicauda salina]
MECIYFVYIMASRRNGTLYCGVTNDLIRRVYEHREGLGDGFTRRYGVKMLVWYETFGDVRLAIQREKTIKKYPRRWKLNLIEAMNPDWRDLWEDIVS